MRIERIPRIWRICFVARESLCNNGAVFFVNTFHKDTRQFHRTSDVWPTISAVLAELDCTDRCVEYSIENTVQSYDRVLAWLNERIAAGERIQYMVNPDHLGLVRVDFARADYGAAP